MTRPDDETLMRWSDGELSPQEVEGLEAAALTDAALAERMAALARLRMTMREAFPAQVDARDRDLARLIAAPAASRPAFFGDVGRWLSDAFAPRHAAAWGGLAAATFVCGLLVSSNFGGEAGLRVAPDGTLATAGLVRVLDTRLAADGPDAEGRGIGLTFKNAEGRWCRTFQAQADGMAGLACRDGDGWAVQALAPIGQAGGEVRTASSDTPDVILTAVDASIAGQSVDAGQEAAARDADWR